MVVVQDKEQDKEVQDIVRHLQTKLQTENDASLQNWQLVTNQVSAIRSAMGQRVVAILVDFSGSMKGRVTQGIANLALAKFRQEKEQHGASLYAVCIFSEHVVHWPSTATHVRYTTKLLL